MLPANANILVVSEGCAPCNRVKRILKNEDIIILDISEADDFNIKTTPTFIVIKNNKEVARVTGVLTLRQYRALMNTSWAVSSNFTGVIYFEGKLDKLSYMILKRIKRFGAKIIVGTPELIIDYKITHLPTFIFVENGKEIGRYVGVKER